MPYRKGSSSPTFWPSSLSTGTALSEPPTKKRKRKAISVQYNTNSHAAFPFRFVKIQTLFHKTDPTGTLNGLRSTKPREFILQGISTHSHAQPRAQNASRLSLSILRKYARYFRTRKKPLDPAALYRQNPKISGLKKPPCADTRHQNVWRSPASCHALTRADAAPSSLHALPRAMRWHTRLVLWRHGWCHPQYPVWPGPTRKFGPVRTACKKKNFK